MTTNTQKAGTGNSLERRARFYARIISLLFARQKLAGGRLTQASRGARHLSLGIRLADSTQLDKALKLSEAVALSANTENVLAQRQAGLIVYQFQLPHANWQSYTRAELPTPEAVGLAERRQPVKFEYQQPHALVAGSTGSGKSETIKTILLSQMTTHTPESLKIVLVDWHGDYADFANEAHLAMPIATTQDDIEQALLYCNHELTRRKADNIKDGLILLLVIDEADKVLSTPARLEIIKAITQEGRKFRVRCIVGTHKPSHTDLPNILDNLLNRFIGLVSDAKMSAALTGHAGLQAHKLTGKGDFIHVAGIDVTRFQVAIATQADFDALERVEIQPIESRFTELIELPTELPEKPVGRPKLELNPDWLAWYFFHHPDRISRAMANEMMGLSRSHHELHRDFCRQFIKAYLQLRNNKALEAPQ